MQLSGFFQVSQGLFHSIALGVNIQLWTINGVTLFFGDQLRGNLQSFHCPAPLNKKGPGISPGARDFLGYDQNVNVQPNEKLFVAQAAAAAVPEKVRVKFVMIGIFTL